MDLPVVDDGIRPAGPSDRCFYCNSPKGEHAPDCVCVKKTVLIRSSFVLVYDVPRHWGKDEIEFHLNESSACMSRLVDQLHEEEAVVGDDRCFTCHRHESEYLRDATEADHENYLPRGHKSTGESTE